MNRTLTAIKRILLRSYYWLRGGGYVFDRGGYCVRCAGCGEPGCCRPKMCDNGFLCAGHYGGRKEREALEREWEQDDS